MFSEIELSVRLLLFKKPTKLSPERTVLRTMNSYSFLLASYMSIAFCKVEGQSKMRHLQLVTQYTRRRKSKNKNASDVKKAEMYKMHNFII